MKYNKKVNDFFKLVISDISAVEHDYKVGVYPKYKGVPLPLPQYEISMGNFRPSIVTIWRYRRAMNRLMEQCEMDSINKLIDSLVDKTYNGD